MKIENCPTHDRILQALLFTLYAERTKHQVTTCACDQIAITCKQVWHLSDRLWACDHYWPRGGTTYQLSWGKNVESPYFSGTFCSSRHLCKFVSGGVWKPAHVDFVLVTTQTPIMSRGKCCCALALAMLLLYLMYTLTHKEPQDNPYRDEVLRGFDL